MSTPAATARYVIAADDKTKAAIASINSGFKSIERNVKGTVKGINTSLSLVAGYGLKRAFQAIFTETAADSREFASALADVKRSAKDLLSPEDGAPAATAALKELAETLKDPDVVKAADDITSALIIGFAKAAEATSAYFTLVSQGFLGWKVMLGLTGDEIENLRVEIDRIDGQIKSLQDTLPGVSGRAAANIRLQIAGLKAESNILAREQLKLIEGKPPTPAGKEFGFDTFLPGGLPGFDVGELNIADDLRKQMEEFQRIENMIPGSTDKAFEKRFGEFIESIDTTIDQGITQTAERARQSIEEVGDAMAETVEQSKASIVFIKQMQEDIFGSVSDLLFSVRDGAEDFGDRMIDTFKRILADKATLDLFNYLAGLGKQLTGSSSGKGFAGWIGAGLTSLFGGIRDSGGRGEKGKGYVISPKAAPEVFWPDSAGTFHPNAAMAGGGGDTFNVTTNVNVAAGAVVTRAEAAQIGQRAADAAVARIKDQRRRGQF